MFACNNVRVPRATCADPGISVRGGGGGVQVSLTKKALTRFFFFFFFFSPQLILQKSNGQFQRILSLFKVPEGVQHFPGGVYLFPGGPNCLFPIETHITCDFPGGGGSGPPVPPLDPHLHQTKIFLLLFFNQIFKNRSVMPQRCFRLIYFLRLTSFRIPFRNRYLRTGRKQ